MQTPTEFTLPLRHLSLSGQRWGDESLPPLLALHGWLDNAGSFACLAPLLAERHHVIALDLPGHGHADHLPAGAGYYYLDYVRDVIDAAQSLQLCGYTLLGHSLGAGVASLVAAAAPETIKRLFLIEGLGPLGDDGSRTLERFREALASSGSGKRLRLFRDIEQALQARSIVSGLPADLARPIVERGLIESDGGWRWRSDPQLTRPSATRLAEAQVHALLRGISVPTSLMLARPTASYLPTGPMQARADCVRDISVRHMDGGHHLHLEYPQQIAEWIFASI